MSGNKLQQQYLDVIGNHEYHYNFSNYKARFTMPRDLDNMYYSFDIGPVHFVSGKDVNVSNTELSLNGVQR